MRFIEFKATDEQLCDLFANAINASSPPFAPGMTPALLAFLVAGHEPVSPDSNEIADAVRSLRKHSHGGVDYFGGRMVKLSIGRAGDKFTVFSGIRADYQSWIRKYPTMRALLESAGISDAVEVDGLDDGL